MSDDSVEIEVAGSIFEMTSTGAICVRRPDGSIKWFWPHKAHPVIDLCASILGNDETIERVARAMCRSSYDGREVWDAIGPMKQNAFRRDVREVMAAMLEVLTT